MQMLVDQPEPIARLRRVAIGRDIDARPWTESMCSCRVDVGGVGHISWSIRSSISSAKHTAGAREGLLKEMEARR